MPEKSDSTWIRSAVASVSSHADARQATERRSSVPNRLIGDLTARDSGTGGV